MVLNKVRFLNIPNPKKKQKMKNLILALKDQLPIKRFFINFFITRNIWGLFHKKSHVSFRISSPNVMYNTKNLALKEAEYMKKKIGVHFSTYKCICCDGYYIGKIDVIKEFKMKETFDRKEFQKHIKELINSLGAEYILKNYKKITMDYIHKKIRS